MTNLFWAAAIAIACALGLSSGTHNGTLPPSHGIHAADDTTGLTGGDGGHIPPHNP